MIDVELVCPDCRRFWHGPAGLLPFPEPRVRCSSPRHDGRRPERVEVIVDGADRYHAKRAAGVSGVKRDGWSGSPDVDREALEVERIAAAKFGVTANEEIYADHGDEGFDFVWFGLKVDAKHMRFPGLNWRSKPSSCLIVNPDEATADIYVAVVGSLDEGFEVVGFCRRETLLAAPRRDFGYGPKLAVLFSDLTPIP